MNTDTKTEVSRLLERRRNGDEDAFSRLFELVYGELRAEAHRHRRRWNADNTLNTTAIVHEAYLRLADNLPDMESRSHFLCVVSKAMRHLLVDYARMRKADKRGGNRARVTLADNRLGTEGMVSFDQNNIESLLSLDDAITELEAHNARWGSVVQCRFFGGMSIGETAEALGVSAATVKRDWALAQVWLHRRMTGSASD